MKFGMTSFQIIVVALLTSALMIIVSKLFGLAGAVFVFTAAMLLFADMKGAI